jgi:hypothetical protein
MLPSAKILGKVRFALSFAFLWLSEMLSVFQNPQRVAGSEG